MDANQPDIDKKMISVIDFATENGFRKQSVFRIMKRLEIESKRVQGGKRHGGQFVAYISKQDANRVLQEILSNNFDVESREDEKSVMIDVSLYDTGVFYLIQLEPEHDPLRIKVGFANNIDERLRQHRCSAPFAQILQIWPCRRLWEKTAIDCVSSDCERLHTEVFRAKSLDCVVTKCNQFFSLMPILNDVSFSD